MCNNPPIPPNYPPGSLVPAAEGAEARKVTEGRPIRAACGCCNGLIVRDGGHDNTPKSALLQRAYTGGYTNKPGANPLHSKITIDTYSPATSSGPGKGRIIITTVMTAINKTAPTKERPLSARLEDDLLEKRIHMIPAAISRYWNALPLKLDITDATCGRNIYDIVFDPQIILSRDGKSVRGTHFKVDIVNVPPQPEASLGPAIEGDKILQGQSYVQGQKVVINIGEDRTATDRKAAGRSDPKADIVEAHEYGHMLGLKDEYNDQVYDRGGVDYILPDGTVQKAKGQQHLMDKMDKQQDARQARYAITIAYAVQDILNKNGRKVSLNKIIGDYI